MEKLILEKKTWNEYRTILNNNYHYNDNWKLVIELFQERINKYYLIPIEQIIEPNNQDGEGFSILTLQCALIEMFASFKQGKIHNNNKPRKGGLKYEYKSSSSCFVDFLQSEEIFENHFFIIKDNLITKNEPFNANEFYDRVRCGLMHEARTKKDWLITSGKIDKLNPKKFIFENSENNTKSINRTVLQKLLKSYFKEKYISELKNDNENGIQLRRFLGRKLDHLYDVEKEINFEWWNDN